MVRRRIYADEYDRRLNEQGGGCAICGVFPAERALAVDHDHNTGEVRGLLCFSCNTALGAFHDSVALLEAAIDYLEGTLTDTVTVTERVEEWKELIGSGAE